jgi:hypothetical protein
MYIKEAAVETSASRAAGNLGEGKKVEELRCEIMSEY